MATVTYDPLATITLATTQATITFSSISQSYRDLVLVMSPIATVANDVRIRFNSDTTSVVNTVYMYGNGTSATGGLDTTSTYFLGPDTVGTTAGQMAILNFMDYSATDKNKSVLMRYDKASMGTRFVTGRWASNSAITQLVIYTSSSTFAAGTTMTLYGVAS